jgi:hypothetical protein
VFLLSRIREHYDRTRDNTAAVAGGRAATTRVITAAAGMVVVFAGFVLGVGRPAVAGNPTGGPVPMQTRQLDLTRHRLPRRRRYARDVCGRPAPAWKIRLRAIKGRPGRPLHGQAPL